MVLKGKYQPSAHSQSFIKISYYFWWNKFISIWYSIKKNIYITFFLSSSVNTSLIGITSIIFIVTQLVQSPPLSISLLSRSRITTVIVIIMILFLSPPYDHHHYYCLSSLCHLHHHHNTTIVTTNNYCYDRHYYYYH